MIHERHSNDSKTRSETITKPPNRPSLLKLMISWTLRCPRRSCQSLRSVGVSHFNIGKEVDIINQQRAMSTIQDIFFPGKECTWFVFWICSDRTISQLLGNADHFVIVGSFFHNTTRSLWLLSWRCWAKPASDCYSYDTCNIHMTFELVDAVGLISCRDSTRGASQSYPNLFKMDHKLYRWDPVLWT